MPTDPTDGESQHPEASETTEGSVEPERVESEEQEYDEPAETPFDHPLFLPVIIAGLWVWFGYDGFLNQDPDMLEHLSFNRWGFAALSVALVWFGFKGWKEMSERSESAED